MWICNFSFCIIKQTLGIYIHSFLTSTNPSPQLITAKLIPNVSQIPGKIPVEDIIGLCLYDRQNKGGLVPNCVSKTGTCTPSPNQWCKPSIHQKPKGCMKDSLKLWRVFAELSLWDVIRRFVLCCIPIVWYRWGMYRGDGNVMCSPRNIGGPFLSSAPWIKWSAFTQ